MTSRSISKQNILIAFKLYVSLAKLGKPVIMSVKTYVRYIEKEKPFQCNNKTFARPVSSLLLKDSCTHSVAGNC